MLLLRRHIGPDRIDAQLARHPLRRIGMVTSQHHQLQSQPVKRGDDCRRRRLDRIGHRE